MKKRMLLFFSTFAFTVLFAVVSICYIISR